MLRGLTLDQSSSNTIHLSGTGHRFSWPVIASAKCGSPTESKSGAGFQARNADILVGASGRAPPLRITPLQILRSARRFCRNPSPGGASDTSPVREHWERCERQASPGTGRKNWRRVIFSPGLRKEFFDCGSAALWGSQFWLRARFPAGSTGRSPVRAGRSALLGCGSAIALWGRRPRLRATPLVALLRLSSTLTQDSAPFSQYRTGHASEYNREPVAVIPPVAFPHPALCGSPTTKSATPPWRAAPLPLPPASRSPTPAGSLPETAPRAPRPAIAARSGLPQTHPPRSKSTTRPRVPSAPLFRSYRSNNSAPCPPPGATPRTPPAHRRPVPPSARGRRKARSLRRLCGEDDTPARTARGPGGNALPPSARSQGAPYESGRTSRRRSPVSKPLPQIVGQTPWSARDAPRPGARTTTSPCKGGAGGAACPSPAQPCPPPITPARSSPNSRGLPSPAGPAPPAPRARSSPPPHTLRSLRRKRCACCPAREPPPP